MKKIIILSNNFFFFLNSFVSLNIALKELLVPSLENDISLDPSSLEYKFLIIFLNFHKNQLIFYLWSIVKTLQEPFTLPKVKSINYNFNLLSTYKRITPPIWLHEWVCTVYWRHTTYAVIYTHRFAANACSGSWLNMQLELNWILNSKSTGYLLNFEQQINWVLINKSTWFWTANQLDF